MNFREHIKTIDRREKTIKVFGKDLVILEMTGADQMRFSSTEDIFERFWYLFDSCVIQEDNKRLDQLLFSDLCKDNMNEVYDIISEILKFSEVIDDIDDGESKKK